MSERRWHKATFIALQTEIREDLRQCAPVDRPQARLDIVRQRLNDLSNANSTEEMMRRYIYSMTALAHHQRWGGLGRREIFPLQEMALAILKVSGVSPRSKSLAFLYADVHLITSQIMRSDSNHFLAHWEQCNAERFDHASEVVANGQRHLASALRRLRRGLGLAALPHLHEACRLLAGHRDYVIAAPVLLKSLRLLDRSDEFIAFATTVSTFAQNTNNEDLEREVIWERECLAIRQNESMSPVLGICRRHRSHHRASYLLEAKLFASALQTTQWLNTFPKVNSMIRNPNLDPRGDAALLKAAQTLEGCYENVAPLDARLARLAHCLDNTDDLVSIEHELLVWLGATRWLARIHHFQHAMATFVQYQRLSVGMTLGLTQDALGLASDIFTAEWFQRATHLQVDGAAA